MLLYNVHVHVCIMLIYSDFFLEHHLKIIFISIPIPTIKSMSCITKQL